MRALVNPKSLPNLLRVGGAFVLASVLFGCGDGEIVVRAGRGPRVGSLKVVANVATEDCPRIEWYTVSPFRHVAHEDVAMEVSATSPQGVTPYYQWLASSGEFSEPTKSATTYHCGSEQSSVVTVTAFYLGCESIVDIVMDCT
jgi:hypothetical protein